MKSFLKKTVPGCVMIASLLTGCMYSSDSNNNKNQESGMVLGGIAGGLIGSAFGKGDGKAAAVGVGVLLGAIIGSEMGAKMDQNDRAMAEHATNQAAQAPIGQSIQWHNDANGHSGSAKTVKVGTDSQGHECRKIEQQVTIDGKTDIITIDICLIDNHWVSSSAS